MAKYAGQLKDANGNDLLLSTDNLHGGYIGVPFGCASNATIQIRIPNSFRGFMIIAAASTSATINGIYNVACNSSGTVTTYAFNSATSVTLSTTANTLRIENSSSAYLNILIIPGAQQVPTLIS